MNAEPPEVTRRQRAEERAERIRGGLEAWAREFAEAILEEDWKALDCDTVQDWIDQYLGPAKFTAEARTQIEEALVAASFTYRQAATITGVSAATVAADLAGSVRDLNTGTPKQQASKDREAKRRQGKGITYTEMPEAELKAVEFADPDQVVTVSAVEFTRALLNVAPFASQDRPALACVRLVASDGVLRVQATDSFAAAQQAVRCDGQAEVRIGAEDAKRIGTTFGAMLRRTPGPHPRVVFGRIAGGGVIFHIDGIPSPAALTAREVEGTYLDVDSLTDAEPYPEVARIGPKYLAKLARVKAGRDDDPVILRLGDDGKRLSADLGDSFRAWISTRRKLDYPRPFPTMTEDRDEKE